jgi:hypothetical protein
MIDAGSGSRIGPATAGPDSAAIYTEKLLASVYQLLILKNRLLNGREAAV